MEQSLSTEIITILDDLSEKAGVAIDWSSANALPYLQDVMNRLAQYKIVTSSIWLISLAILLIISIVVFRKQLKIGMEKESQGKNADAEAIWSVISIIAFAISVIAIPLLTDQLCKWLFVPEIQMIEYIGKLM